MSRRGGSGHVQYMDLFIGPPSRELPYHLRARMRGCVLARLSAGPVGLPVAVAVAVVVFVLLMVAVTGVVRP
jgi:hypothetical protein